MLFFLFGPIRQLSLTGYPFFFFSFSFILREKVLVPDFTDIQFEANMSIVCFHNPDKVIYHSDIFFSTNTNTTTPSSIV